MISIAQISSVFSFPAPEIVAEGGQLADLTENFFQSQRQRAWKRTDRMFALLLVVQWLAGIAIAFWVTPHTWIGAQSSVHLHVLAAIFLGGAIAGFPFCWYSLIRDTWSRVTSSPARRCWPRRSSSISVGAASRRTFTSSGRWPFSRFTGLARAAHRDPGHGCGSSPARHLLPPIDLRHDHARPVSLAGTRRLGVVRGRFPFHHVPPECAWKCTGSPASRQRWN